MIDNNRMLKLSPIVCICGSLKYWHELIQANAMLVTKSIIAVGSGFSMKYPDMFPVVKDYVDENPEKMKTIFDTLHFQKILLADAIWVLNVNDYIGDSTKREIKFANATGRLIYAIEPCSFCDTSEIEYQIVPLEATSDFPDKLYSKANKYYLGDVAEKYKAMCSHIDGK